MISIADATTDCVSAPFHYPLPSEPFWATIVQGSDCKWEGLLALYVVAPARYTVLTC